MNTQIRPFSAFHAIVILLLAAVVAGDISLLVAMFNSR